MSCTTRIQRGINQSTNAWLNSWLATVCNWKEQEEIYSMYVVKYLFTAQVFEGYVLDNSFEALRIIQTHTHMHTHKCIIEYCFSNSFVVN